MDPSGHLLGMARNVFFGDGEMSVHERPRLPLEIHGTGCTLSALLCVFLARGYRPKEAFLAAEAEMDELLDELYQPEAAPSASKETSGCQYLSMSLRQAWMGLQLHLLVAAHQLALFRTAVWMIALAAGLDHLKLDPARRTYVRLAHFHIHTGCHGSSFHRRCLSYALPLLA
jgi:hypothetical protein